MGKIDTHQLIETRQSVINSAAAQVSPRPEGAAQERQLFPVQRICGGFMERVVSDAEGIGLWTDTVGRGIPGWEEPVSGSRHESAQTGCFLSEKDMEKQDGPCDWGGGLDAD